MTPTGTARPALEDGAVRVLYARADEAGPGLVREHLNGGAPRFVVEVAGSGEACLRRVLAEPFDALLLDHPLPGRSALEVLREVRARGLTIPIVVVALRGGEAAGAEALRLGADDYLVRREGSLARLALTLDHAIAHRQAREERDGLAMLAALLTSISSDPDLPGVLARVLEAARRLLGTERNLILLEHGRDTLVPHAWDGFAPCGLEGARFRASGGVFGRALAAAGPVDLAGATLEGRSPAAEILHGCTGFVTPLTAGERALGVLVVATTAARRFSKTDARLLQALAEHAASALDHARRLAAATSRGERLSALVQVTQRIADHRPSSDLPHLIVGEARRLVDATVAALRLVDGDELAVATCAGEAAGASWPACLPIGEGLCGRVAVSGRPIRMADLQTEGLGAGQAVLVADGLHSYLGVPLLMRGRVTGVLSAYARDADRFTDDDVALLAGLASQAAIAVENARLADQLLHAERLSSVGRVVAGVAHELNNPLAVVIGTADLLQREGVEARVAERLQRISGQAQRAVKIARSLLALARKKPAQRTEVDVNLVLDETLELEGYELRSARVAVVRQFGPDLPSVLADPDQLQQVFTNLFLNATEAMRQAHVGGTLTVATRSDAASERLLITVTDDGPGIQAHDLPRIFEPFFTTKSEDKGTGLGLAICRQILDNHGGRITVESQPGAGATFTVELPVSRVTGRRVAEPSREERTAGEAAVLLVEDERVVGDLVGEFLALDGHRVDRAGNGREALDLIKAGRAYALIVSDVRMPDLDGPALYHALRAIDPELTRRIVFITGDVMSPETRRFLDETGLSYLEKPFGIAEFQSVIRGVLGRGQAQAPRSRRTA